MVSPSGYMSQPPSGAGVTLKSPGHQAGGAVEQRERFPAGGLVAENVLARPDANDVHAQRRPEFVVHFGQHLVRLVDARRRSGRPDQPLLELVDDRGVDSGDPGAPEVHADPVGLAVIQGTLQPFARGHRRHIAPASIMPRRGITWQYLAQRRPDQRSFKRRRPVPGVSEGAGGRVGRSAGLAEEVAIEADR